MNEELQERICDAVERCFVSEWTWCETTEAIVAEIEAAGFAVIERDVLARVAHAAGFARSEFGVDACRLVPGDVHAALTAAKRP
jgi:hypothetical protein